MPHDRSRARPRGRAWRKVVAALAALVAGCVVAGAQGHAQDNAQDNELGRSEFARSCASCHGVSGKGDGPDIKSLVKPPPDLTRLAERNNGEFPFLRVYDVIDGRLAAITHGTRDMPVWGQVYRRGIAAASDRLSSEAAEALVRLRILALIEHLEALQGK